MHVDYNSHLTCFTGHDGVDLMREGKEWGGNNKRVTLCSVGFVTCNKYCKSTNFGGYKIWRFSK